MMHELLAHGMDLHAAECFQGIEPGMRLQVPVSLATMWARDPRQIVRRQAELKAHAARESGLADPLTAWLTRRCRRPADIDQWVPQAARRKHIEGSLEVARRSCDPLFAYLVSYIPVDIDHHRNEQAAIAREWGHGDLVFGIAIGEASPERRSVELRRWQLRQRLLRLVESVVHLANAGDSHAAPSLLSVTEAMEMFGPLAARGRFARTSAEQLDQALAACTGVGRDLLQPLFGHSAEGLLTDTTVPFRELVT